jgi:gas vesicle protein
LDASLLELKGDDVMSSSNGGYSFVAGFFLGSALGAAVALLIAPKSGRELRESFAEEGKKLKQTTSRNVSELREKSGELYGKAREAIHETAGGVKKAARTITQSPAEVIDESC